MAVAAVGEELADHTAYLMRLAAAGIGRDDLIAFLKAATRHIFPEEMLRRKPQKPRFRYLLSLDSLAGWLIEDETGRPLLEAPPTAGHIYHRAGALYAGQTQPQRQPTRYIDKDGMVRSVYNSGRNIAPELKEEAQVRFIKNDTKHRFVFVLAEPQTLEYRTWRAALPPWVREYEWGENGLGWIQPRLLSKAADGHQETTNENLLPTPSAGFSPGCCPK